MSFTSDQSSGCGCALWLGFAGATTVEVLLDGDAAWEMELIADSFGFCRDLDGSDACGRGCEALKGRDVEFVTRLLDTALASDSVSLAEGLDGTDACCSG